MKLKEIMIFLLIFSFVMNGLTALKILQTSYGSPAHQVQSLETAEAALYVFIGLQILVIVGVSIATGLLSYRAGIPGDRASAYGLLGGLIASTLVAGYSTLSNIYRAVPSQVSTGYVIVVAIFLSILVVIISWTYVEFILGVRAE